MLLQAEEAKPGGAPRKGRAVSPGLLARMKAFSNDESDSNRQRPAQGMSPRRSVSPRLKERVNSSRPAASAVASGRPSLHARPAPSGSRWCHGVSTEQQQERTPVLSGTSTLKPGGNYPQSSAQLLCRAGTRVVHFPHAASAAAQSADAQARHGNAARAAASSPHGDADQYCSGRQAARLAGEHDV